LKLVQTGDNCNVIFLSDGGFDPRCGLPDCKCTGFLIDGSVGVESSLSSFCQEVHAVGPNFGPADVGFDMLKGETRTEFWEEGVYTPMVREGSDVQYGQLSIPSLQMEGSAIGYKKTETAVMAYRAIVADPILAYREADAGYVGTLVTNFPALWVESADGRAAIQDWILHTVPYAERERYEFRVDDLGRSLKLQISLLSEGGQLPQVTGLKVQIEFGDTRKDVTMSSETGIPGVFTGFIESARSDQAQSAMLVIEEVGPDALSRPQRVPLLLPPEGKVTAGSNEEANTWGVNEALLRDLTTRTGGGYDPDQGITLLRDMPPLQTGRDLWPILALLAAWCYWIAILVRRLG